MIPVPAGEFWMGCNSTLDGECFASEEPYHLVTIPAFEIDMYEVTVTQYHACVVAGGCTPSDPDGATFFWSYCTWDVAGKEEHPINCVTWYQARDYCAWAGKRLCTEAEWEKASRGGCELYADCAAESQVYPWGNQTATCDYAVMDDGGHACGTQSTFPVGSKPQGASPYGVMDLSGNVYEWIRDCYFGDYLGTIDNRPPTDGSAWETPDCADLDKVSRGGSWYDFAHTLRSSHRLWREPAGNTGTQGFRCCR
jgi:formylglycine-generating enzyme required for sulfatase activity